MAHTMDIMTHTKGTNGELLASFPKHESLLNFFKGVENDITFMRPDASGTVVPIGKHTINLEVHAAREALAKNEAMNATRFQR